MEVKFLHVQSGSPQTLCPCGFHCVFHQEGKAEAGGITAWDAGTMLLWPGMPTVLSSHILHCKPQPRTAACTELSPAPVFPGAHAFNSCSRGTRRLLSQHFFPHSPSAGIQQSPEPSSTAPAAGDADGSHRPPHAAPGAANRDSPLPLRPYPQHRSCAGSCSPAPTPTPCQAVCGARGMHQTCTFHIRCVI